MKCEVGQSCGCNFKNTGANYSHVWDGFHKLIDSKVDCQECNIHGHESISGLRDHIKAGIGSKPYNLNNYHKFVREVNCVYEKCKADGRC